jgi:glycine/D-amino acid oxidase-like deaminating enzyme
VKHTSVLATPYWQEDGLVPRLAAPPPPAAVDVLIVGAGYTGLSAARETSAAGASTLVLEAGAVGAGCSGRNGGQVAYSIKPTFAALKARYGEARAVAIAREGLAAMDHLRTLATAEGLDCEWRAHGCYYGAHTPRHFTTLKREAENQPRGLEQRVSIVTRAQQRDEIDSDFYHGGLVYHDDAAVNPMRMLRALLERAQGRGALVLDHCRVLSLTRERDGFSVSTSRGVVKARKVLLATNGYSGPLSPWHRRRVIPIGSYQIATEPLGVERVRQLIPRLRNIVDTRRVVVYYRPSPDGERIIFGGRAALAEQDPLACLPRLKSMLTEVFPQLADARLTHAWAGWVAYTFDTLPHLGEDDGLYYCMGYCGQGVPLAPYFGCRIGQQMMGLAAGRTALDGLNFPSRPYYSGVPWFLAPSVLAYRTLDSLGF